MEGNITGYQH